MKLRRLTPPGIQRFKSYISELRKDPSLEPPLWLLEDAESSETAGDVKIAPQDFQNRLEAARYLDQLFEQAGLGDVSSDVGLWAWLTLFLFDQVCPARKHKPRKPSREDFRYIPAVGDFRKYYRHLLLGPYLILRAHRKGIEKAIALLASPVPIINDVVEQIASRQEWISNPEVIGVATALYVDPKSMAYKQGAGGKGDGSPRRLSDVLDQFDLTYDLSGMQRDAILALLPREFERFRS